MPRETHKNKVYSAELKIQAVQDYLAGKGKYAGDIAYQLASGFKSGFHAIMAIVVPISKEKSI